MAPFITHLVIAEHLWPLLAEQWPGAHGDFLAGNLAPDVDKFCPDLDQATTHLVGKDETNAWLTQRSRHFIDRPTGVLQAPFPDLTPSEQAFALGYLCHLAADEATADHYQNYRQIWEARSGLPLPSEAIGVVIDETAAGLLPGREKIVAVLENSRMPTTLLPAIPAPCLAAMRWIVFPFIGEGGGLDAYIGLVRRNSLWQRHGQIGEEPVDQDLEAKLIPYRQRLLDDEAQARTIAGEFDIHSVIAASLEHCRARLVELAHLG